MSETDLMIKWKKEEESINLRGWDFSHIAAQWDCPDPPWNYKLIVESYLKDADILLDMGTGGGEVLLTIDHPYKNTYVTEAYVPNYELCKKTLTPLGITVAQTFTDDKLPFENEYFDFIINRHESFDVSEVMRTLKHKGYFFTQQVGNHNCSELEIILNEQGDTHGINHTIENYADALTQHGFQIIMKDDVEFPVRFFDVEAVIFYSKACPWNIPDFSVETHFDKLCKIQQEIDKYGFLQVTGHRFLLASRKMKPSSLSDA